jgi:hypothetical protein
MGLKREIIAIPLLGGLDTKSDAKVVVPGQLVSCENGEFTKGGSLRKRAGHTATPAALTDGTPITDGLGLAALGDGWVLLGRQNAYLHDPVRNAWSTLGPFTPITYTAVETANASAQQDNPDIASVNGITVLAWEDSRGGIRFSVFDDASGAVLASEVSVASANVTRPKCAVAGPNIIVAWHNSSTTAIEARIVQSANVAAVSSTANITLAANANAAVQFDMVGGDDVAYLAYRQDAGVADNTQLVVFSPAGVAIRSATAFSDVPNVGPALAWHEASNSVFVARTNTAAVELTIRKFDGTTLAQTAEVITASSTETEIVLGPNSAGGVSRWSQTGSGSTRAVGVIRYDSTLTALTTTKATTHSVLASAGWQDEFNTYVLTAYAGVSITGLQGAYYIQRDDGVVVGRLVYGSGHDLTTNLTHPKPLGNEQFVCAVGFRRQVPVNLAKVLGAPTSKMTPVYQHRGVKRVDLNCKPKLTPVEIDGVLYVNGAWLWAIDGAGCPMEAQMQMFPDIAAAGHVSAAGGNLTASASYSYRWYYEWTNGRGHRVRSLALTVTVSTTGANFQFNITLPCTAYTRSRPDLGGTGTRSNIAIVGYRSEANNNNFHYRITDSNPVNNTGNNRYVDNSAGSNTVAFVDNLSDANLTGREIDYLSQGEVEHLAFDGPAAIGEAGNRLWCIGGGENPDRPQFSLVRTDGRAIEGNDSFVVTEFPEEGGRTVAISQVNGIPVVFKERAIYAIEGDGTQNNRDDSRPYIVRQVSSDVGCTEPRSVLATAEGVYFKSAKGIRLLGQNFVPEYIGAFVEAYNSQDVTGAAVVPDTDQCVFLTDDGLALMYDYFYKRWSTYTNHQGQSLAAGRSGFAYLRNDGQLYVRDSRSADTRDHTDAGVPYRLRFRLAPIRIEDTIQGSWLCRKVMAIGEYRSPHELEVRVFRNRETWPNQIITWQPDLRMGQTVWGSETVWGDPTSVWGGIARSNEYSFDRKLRARKVSTISFEVSDIPGSPPGASYELTELALEMYPHSGLARMPATRKS